MHVFQPENRFMYEKQQNFLSTAKSGIFNYDNSEKDKQKTIKKKSTDKNKQIYQ